MKTGIIIPCYNESKRLNTEAFLQFSIKNQDYHLCFVNDGSKDNTIQVLENLRIQNPNGISIIDIKKNIGKAGAVRAGSRYLFTRNDIDAIGFMDADLSTDFRDFKELVKTLKTENKIMVFGSRKSGNDGIKRNATRGILSKIVKGFILLILGLPITDTQCGAKVFKKDVVPTLFEKAFVSRWLFDVEIFLRLKKQMGSKNIMNSIFEQPLMRWVHMEDSKLGLKDSVKIPMKLMQIWFAYNTPQLFINQFQQLEPSVEIMHQPAPALQIAA